MSLPTVLVTGAAGFIGSSFVDRLLSSGYTVVGVDNFDPFYAREHKERNLANALTNPAFTLHEIDCCDTGALRGALRDTQIDVVVHLAAKAGVRPSLEDPLGYLHANVLATQSMLQFAQERSIKRIVFGSSSSVYGNGSRPPFTEHQRTDNPISPYAASKKAAEVLCAAHNHLFGTSIVALRFFTVYGPRQRPDLAIRKFATLMLQGKPVPLFGDGSTARDYTWIDDILDGVVAAIDRTKENDGQFEVINLGGSATTTLHKLVELLSDALGITPTIERLPMQPGDVNVTFADVRKAGRLLGYQPRTPIEQGIPRFVSWLREYQLSVSERWGGGLPAPSGQIWQQQPGSNRGVA